MLSKAPPWQPQLHFQRCSTARERDGRQRCQDGATPVPSPPRRLRDPVLPAGNLPSHWRGPQGINVCFWKRDEGSGISTGCYSCCFAEIHLGPVDFSLLVKHTSFQLRVQKKHPKRQKK